MEQVENQIEERMKELDSVILTVPGIGSTNVTTILGEIGNIHRFSSTRKLVIYAGFETSVMQFGEFEASHNVMSKRESPYLRKALFSSAVVEGKHHLTAIGAVSRKLCYIIHANLVKNEPYEIR